MLNAINTKLLIGIVGLLTVIAGALTYQARETAKATAILTAQEAERQKAIKADEEYRKQVKHYQQTENFSWGGDAAGAFKRGLGDPTPKRKN